MLRVLRYLVGLGLVVAGVLWFLARPAPLDEADVAGLTGDAAKGEADGVYLDDHSYR